MYLKFTNFTIVFRNFLSITSWTRALCGGDPGKSHSSRCWISPCSHLGCPPKPSVRIHSCLSQTWWTIPRHLLWNKQGYGQKLSFHCDYFHNRYPKTMHLQLDESSTMRVQRLCLHFCQIRKVGQIPFTVFVQFYVNHVILVRDRLTLLPYIK